MQTTIDIKTPSGKSLEGFPVTGDIKNTDFFLSEKGVAIFTDMDKEFKTETQLHKGDRIIIEIGE